MELHGERHLFKLTHVYRLLDAISRLCSHRDGLAAMTLVHLDASVGKTETDNLVARDGLTYGTQHQVVRLGRMSIKIFTYAYTCLIGDDIIEPRSIYRGHIIGTDAHTITLL